MGIRIQRNPDGSLMYNWYDPRNVETGFTELVWGPDNPNVSMTRGTGMSNSSFAGSPYANLMGADANGNTTNSSGATSQKIINQQTVGNPVTRTAAVVGGDGRDGTNPDPVVARPSFEEILRGARDAAKRNAEYGFGRARGIYDEGIGQLTKRKQEFQDLFDQGRERILDTYEGERGNLQASSEGARTRMSNALRALGLGGSAFIKSEGRQTQNEAKALGGLQTERNTNENANQNEFNTRQDWASAREADLGRYLQDAENTRNSIDSSSDLNYLNDMASIFDKIVANQMSAKAAVGDYTANPYSVNMSSMLGALNGSLPTMSGGANAVQNVNLQEQNPTLELLKKRGGVAGAGLYGKTAY